MLSTARLETRTKECELLASVVAHWKRTREMKVNSVIFMNCTTLCGEGADSVSRNHGRFCSYCMTDPEQVAHDPKDGDLCLGRAKPRETMVEARSGSDVQIDRLTWA